MLFEIAADSRTMSYSRHLPLLPLLPNKLPPRCARFALAFPDFFYIYGSQLRKFDTWNNGEGEEEVARGISRGESPREVASPPKNTLLLLSV